MSRFKLHAGQGRTWHIEDTAMSEFCVDQDDDVRALRERARKLQDKYDWWEVYDEDDGMGSHSGWMTGRSTPHLIKARDVPPLPRHVRRPQEANAVR